ncbi:hypothetical protein D1AOALGA4SA_4822 [Olavius algarvensis Delta 1 endosymbiont]|nr:hypothetical protein D1AOALGA4SA_4822 [Olavius algarvensis Delta 1 endosymbiont]
MSKTSSKIDNHRAAILFGSFNFLNFEFVSNFVIRYSDLLLLCTLQMFRK